MKMLYKPSSAAWFAGLLLTVLTACQPEKINPSAAAIPSTAGARAARKLYVVLGSSTAVGTGASRADSTWVGRCRNYLLALPPNKSGTITNLAVGGFTTYQILPTGHPLTANRPAPDPAHNITKALSYNPNAILINMPTNDIANGYAVSEVMDNLAIVANAAQQRGVTVWVSTSQPRNLWEGGRQRLRLQKQYTQDTYLNHSLDFWTGLASSTDSILPQYSYGDGVHLNDAGHRILYQRVVAGGVFNAR